MVKIYWYRHSMENRNDLLRFGLMRLHAAKKIIYIEQDISQVVRAGFSKEVAIGDHHHLSFLSLESESANLKIIIDNEDSFIHCSPYLSEADFYFTAAYNADFYEQQQFPSVYAWQDEPDISWYRAESSRLIVALSSHFHKVRRFIPIGPNLISAHRRTRLQQISINVTNRLSLFFLKRNYWRPALADFEKRYQSILMLRSNRAHYDVVLNDTLWGWPLHRIKLHHRLASLAADHEIHSILNWHPPYAHDGSRDLKIDKREFPISSGKNITDYERMLSESRLGLFATGFHWGWRNIMTLSLCIGLPVYMDKPIFEPYFDFTQFITFWNEGGNWDYIRPILDTLITERHQEIKMHNQSIYDRYMSPEIVAQYIIDIATGK